MASWSSPDDQELFSFLDRLDQNFLEDVEEKQGNGKFFDPVVGGRNSSARSSSSRSSGSTGFFEAVELSPSSTSTTASMSPPLAFDSLPQDFTDDCFALTQSMSSLNLANPLQDLSFDGLNKQALANLAALAQLSSTYSPTNLHLPLQPAKNFEQQTLTQDMSNNDRHAQMQIRCKFGTLGEYYGQFSSPHGFCMGLNEDIVVADTDNHRIQIFDKNGNFKYAFGTPGKEEGCLYKPRKVAVLKESGNFVICDRGNERSRMQIFSPFGHFIRRIAIRFVDIVAGLAISREGHIVVVDSVTPTIFIIHENGALLRHIECSRYMTEPSDIAVFRDEFYICDFKGHSVIVMHENGNFLRRIDCRPVTHYPNGIDISDAGDILVGDSHGNQFHVAIFDRLGDLAFQFHCPQVKVSRCCGLKITSEGFIVTVAKNNHHVLVLNTLYLP